MYPSDLSAKQWSKIRHFFKRADPRGSAGYHDKQDVVNAILYVVKGGIQWRMLPKDYPPWQTVYDHYRQWNIRGVWEQALDVLNAEVRVSNGRNKLPTYGIIDSQSAKTIYASDERGIDGGKKNKGQKASYYNGHNG